MKSEKQVFERFITIINQHAMVCDGDRVLVALSGGADSVALLYLMLDLRSLFDIEVLAAHLNHLLRGREADGDERFVRDLCRRLEVPCATAKMDVRLRARKEKKNIESAAREARLEFLTQAARRSKATRIALGHSMNDQAENVLFRLLRGSGSSGLSSMKPVDGIFIRPLLWMERDMIESYLRERDIPYRIDSSNEDLRFTRNKIRHTLIPILKAEYNPRIISTLARTAELLSDEDSFLDSLATEILTRESHLQNDTIRLPSELIRTASPALARRMLRSAVKMLRGELKRIHFRDIEKIRQLAIRGARTKRLLLLPRLHVTINFLNIVISKGIPTTLIRKTIHTRLAIEGKTAVENSGIIIEARIVGSRSFTEDLKRGGRKKAYLDFGKTGGELTLQSPQKGDSFHPFNAPGRKKVSDFFIDRKVPSEERASSLIVTSRGEIVWIVGHEIDDRFKVDDTTKRILILELAHESGSRGFSVQKT